MRKFLSVFSCLCCLLFIGSCAFRKDNELIDMHSDEENGRTEITWEDRTYVPFCVVSKSDCGTQIGYLNGNTDDWVCQYKDYPTSEWIANYLTVDGGAILLKEIHVTSIPNGLQSEYDFEESPSAGLQAAENRTSPPLTGAQNCVTIAMVRQS